MIFFIQFVKMLIAYLHERILEMTTGMENQNQNEYRKMVAHSTKEQILPYCCSHGFG